MGKDISHGPSCSRVSVSTSWDVTLARPAVCPCSQPGATGSGAVASRELGDVAARNSSRAHSRVPPPAPACRWSSRSPSPSSRPRWPRSLSEGPRCGAGLAPEQRETGKELQSPFPMAAVLQGMVTASPPPPFPVWSARCLLCRILAPPPAASPPRYRSPWPCWGSVAQACVGAVLGRPQGLQACLGLGSGSSLIWLLHSWGELLPGGGGRDCVGASVPALAEQPGSSGAGVPRRGSGLGARRFMGLRRGRSWLRS